MKRINQSLPCAKHSKSLWWIVNFNFHQTKFTKLWFFVNTAHKNHHFTFWQKIELKRQNSNSHLEIYSFVHFCQSFFPSTSVLLISTQQENFGHLACLVFLFSLFFFPSVLQQSLSQGVHFGGWSSERERERDWERVCLYVWEWENEREWAGFQASDFRTNKTLTF